MSLLLSIPGLLNAQNWCPAGATWTYTLSNSWTIEGFARFTYAGDTTINGDTCQFILAHYQGYDHALAQPFFYEGAPLFTKVSGGLVSIRTTTGFDTLYNFNAVPGDHWRVTMDDGSEGAAVVQITDTGTVQVDGMALRFVSTGTDTMMERLGGLNTFMLPWVGAMLDAAHGSLRCYADTELNYFAPTWPFGCESLLGVSAIDGSAPVSLFPNPGTDHFILSLEPGVHAISLFDMAGREVLTARVNAANVRIETSQLPAGLYAIKLDEARRPLRWLKL